MNGYIDIRVKRGSTPVKTYIRSESMTYGSFKQDI